MIITRNFITKQVWPGDTLVMIWLITIQTFHIQILTGGCQIHRTKLIFRENSFGVWNLSSQEGRCRDEAKLISYMFASYFELLWELLLCALLGKIIK